MRFYNQNLLIIQARSEGLKIVLGQKTILDTSCLKSMALRGLHTLGQNSGQGNNLEVFLKEVI